MNTGLENPGKIVKVALPAEMTLTATVKPSERIRIGMNPQETISLFGEPTNVEFSQIDGQPVAHLVYSALNTNASTQFTFIDNVLTRFSFIPESRLNSQ